MASNRLLYLALLILAGAFYFASGVWFAWILLVLLLAAPWVSLLVSLPAMLSCRLSVGLEETVEQGIEGSAEIGFEHVHMGDAVLGEDNVFYGHTHPPLEVRGSLFCQKDFEDQFEQMIRCGFIGRGKEREHLPGGEAVSGRQSGHEHPGHV